MTLESNHPETSALVEISPATSDLVERELSDETDEVKSETKALIEALKRRAQVEAQSAGTLTREAYLNAVRRARATLEHNQLIERTRIDNSIDLLHREAEKNWESLTKEIADMGDRVSEAAKAAWDVLTTPRPPK